MSSIMIAAGLARSAETCALGGKVAVVTGSTSGSGFGIAGALDTASGIAGPGARSVIPTQKSKGEA